MRLRAALLLVVGLAPPLGGCTPELPPRVEPTGAAESLEPAPAGHDLVVLEVSGQGVAEVSRRRLEMAAPTRRGQPRDEAWRLRLVDAAGRLVWEERQPSPCTVHVESPAPDGRLEQGGATTLERCALSVRIPLWPPGAALRLSARPDSIPAAWANRPPSGDDDGRLLLGELRRAP